MNGYRSFIGRATLPALLLLLSIVAQGCLIADKKIVTYTVEPDGSGSGTILYTNLKSMEDQEEDVSLIDYRYLVEEWLHGDTVEVQYPLYRNVKKRLYSVGNALIGEITFTFDHYAQVGLYRHEEKGPYMYYTNLETSNVQFYDTSNGTIGSPMMPILFWPAETKSFTIVNIFDHGERPAHSLNGLFKKLGTDLNLSGDDD